MRPPLDRNDHRRTRSHGKGIVPGDGWLPGSRRHRAGCQGQRRDDSIAKATETEIQTGDGLLESSSAVGQDFHAIHGKIHGSSLIIYFRLGTRAKEILKDQPFIGADGDLHGTRSARPKN